MSVLSSKIEPGGRLSLAQRVALGIDESAAKAGDSKVRRYLPDSNVVSETRKRKPHGAVVAWLTELRDDQISLSAVTLGELQSEIELTRRHDPKTRLRSNYG